MFRKTFTAAAVVVSCFASHTEEAAAGDRGRLIAAGILEAIANGLAPRPQPQPWIQPQPWPQPQPQPQPWPQPQPMPQPQPQPMPQPADVVYDNEAAMPGYPLTAQLPLGVHFVQKRFKLRKIQLVNVQQQVVDSNGFPVTISQPQNVEVIVEVARWVSNGPIVPPQPQPQPQPGPLAP